MQLLQTRERSPERALRRRAPGSVVDRSERGGTMPGISALYDLAGAAG
jgi:hypothetical protein